MVCLCVLCVRLIVLVVVLTEVCSAFLNGAIVNRLRGGAKGDNVISGKVAMTSCLIIMYSVAV